MMQSAVHFLLHSGGSLLKSFCVSGVYPLTIMLLLLSLYKCSTQYYVVTSILFLFVIAAAAADGGGVSLRNKKYI
jgi:hypothetical protein